MAKAIDDVSLRARERFKELVSQLEAENPSRSRVQIAVALGIGTDVLSSIMNDRRTPGPGTIETIHDHFRLHRDWFYERHLESPSFRAYMRSEVPQSFRSVTPRRGAIVSHAADKKRGR
jgi:hypothetical protein